MRRRCALDFFIINILDIDSMANVRQENLYGELVATIWLQKPLLNEPKFL